MLDLSLRYENNGTYHDDIEMRFAGQAWICDSYYFALDRNVRPDDESPEKVKAVLQELLVQWLTTAASLGEGEVAFLPFDFSDQCTGWMRFQRKGDEMILSQGWSRLEGHSVSPSLAGRYFYHLPDFEVASPTLGSSREDLLDSIRKSLSKLR